jgi:hypothetical protein
MASKEPSTHLPFGSSLQSQARDSPTQLAPFDREFQNERIRDVWVDNFFQEMKIISSYIENYNCIAMVSLSTH